MYESKKRKSFSHFSNNERNEIYLLRKKGYSYEDVGKALSRATSAIWNEVQVNKVRGVYDPKKAQHKAYVSRHDAKYQGK
ncbi:MAG: helix-turn-helix domain-containing protein, partial [Nitrosarchaeum sp.]|nr:helix-turn-helix domain-containing protein [Nitrosarchaeum sp.]